MGFAFAPKTPHNHQMTFALCAVATLLVLFLTGLHRRKIEAVPFESVDEAAATQPRMRIDEVV